MKKFDLVKNYMNTDPILFNSDMDILEAINTLLQKSISGASVINKEGQLVGMLSEKDCLKIVIRGIQSEDPSGTGKVADFMSHNVKTLSENMDVVEAANEFIHSYYRRFPVVNDNGELVGQISRHDVLRAINKISPNEKIIPSSWVGREPGQYQTKH